MSELPELYKLESRDAAAAGLAKKNPEQREQLLPSLELWTRAKDFLERKAASQELPGEDVVRRVLQDLNTLMATDAYKGSREFCSLHL